jgi:type II secretory pathway component GspD/PulD (secretin)
MDLGVNFALLDDAQNNLFVSGSGNLLNTAVGFNRSTVINALGKVADGDKSGFAADEHGIKFGFVDDDVTGFIRALQQKTVADVLASPRVVVLNKQRADLIIGERIGYKTLTLSQSGEVVETINFLNVEAQRSDANTCRFD